MSSRVLVQDEAVGQPEAIIHHVVEMNCTIEVTREGEVIIQYFSAHVALVTQPYACPNLSDRD